MSLDSKIAKVYKQASKELTKKVDSFFANFERLDKKKRADVDAGKLTEAEYKKWRKNKILRGNDFIALRDNVADAMLDANKIAASYINDELIPAYTKGFNRIGSSTAKEIPGYAFTLTNENTVKRLVTNKETILPYKFVDGKKDTRWNAKRVNSAVLQGIIQGEPASKIAKRLMQVTEMNKDSAIRNARTALTGATNHGRQDGMKQLQDDGVILEKVWYAALDSHTREAHEELHMVSVPIDEPFENSIGQIMFPGDPDADPANVYNCRCSIATKIIGFKKKDDGDDGDDGNGDKDDDDKEESRRQNYSVEGMTEPERPRRSDFEDEDAYYAARDEYRAEKEAFNQQMEEKINEAVSVERFETKEDFVAWAEENNVLLMEDVADKIDLRAMNEVSQTLDEMFERFPELKGVDMLDYDGSIYHSQFALMVDPDGFMSWRGGIAFSEQRFGNYESAVRDALYSMVDGHNVMGDGTFSTMIRHECGHGIESYIQTNIIGRGGILTLDDWRGHFPSLEAYRSACDEVRKTLAEYDADLRSLFRAGMEGQSEYAGQDLRELFAEGFAEWSSGGQTEFGKAFGEFFGRWYK